MSDYKKYKILNIGCGIKKIKNAWNIDNSKKVGPNEVVDITKKLPYNSNHFKKIIADYVLCQIGDTKKFVKTMNEIWRILKPDGIFEFKVPNAEFPEAFRDPMDCRYFTPETFNYFDIRHHRWSALKYGFKPWYKISIKPYKKTRLSVKITPYKK